MPPFRHTLPVRFADIDHAGIVYFARFYEYVHMTLEALFRDRLGVRGFADLLDRDRVGIPAVDTRCQFLSPLRFGDMMDVELSVARLGRASIHFAFQIFRHPDKDDSEAFDPTERIVCAEGTYVTVVVDLDAFKSSPIPPRLLEILRPLAKPAVTEQA